MKTYAILAFALLTLILSTPSAHCSDSGSGWTKAGIRAGLQAGPKREYFHLYELFGEYELPWDWRSDSGWGVDTQLNGSLGALHTAADTGVMATLGTGITLSKTGYNLFPELGISLSLTDKRHYGKQDFGSILLFGGYIGLAYRFDSGISVGYRLLHISNNRILYGNNTPNPGLDMHMVGISWNF